MSHIDGVYTLNVSTAPAQNFGGLERIYTSVYAELLELYLSAQISRGVSHSAGRQNSKSIGVDMVFYYGPAQSSRSFICAFKLFTFSFVNPVAWLQLVSATKACFPVMYGTMISASVQEIWLSVRYVISKCSVQGSKCRTKAFILTGKVTGAYQRAGNFFF